MDRLKNPGNTEKASVIVRLDDVGVVKTLGSFEETQSPISP